ncbi:MAG: sigma-70 family RNA polymerase sigma factor [Nonomuraea sp.]|nr:sigma-70 family RNA polymerase sigma factor [Nonomuraea sp.]NUT39367.1 sigma-70 family RNA polymerase sigma factor [Thermoactinospora sp.]
MWRTLSDDARRAIREMCDTHGSRLYDYCRTELAAGDAEQAVAGTLVSAHLYADRLPDPALHRPWLYALARAHRAIVAKPASIGSWSRPGRMSELLPEALLSLDRPLRELLDLSVRHGLTDAELATVFGLRPAEVRDIVTRAADGLEEWFAAIIAARGRTGCPDLNSRVAAWVTSPGRRARARISRHIQGCATCRAAPRSMSAATLLRRLPIAALPGTLTNRLASAQPLPGEGPLWRADGFPVQARTLVEPLAAPPVVEATPMPPVADPTTATPGKPWSAAGAAAADQVHRGQAARGRHPFTPTSRTRPFRGGPHGDKLVYDSRGLNGTVVNGVNGTSNGNGNGNGTTIIRYGGIGWEGELAELDRPPGETPPWQEFWREPPRRDEPEPEAPIRTVARIGLIMGVGLLVVGLVWAVLNAREHPAVITKAAALTSLPSESPSRWVARAGTAAAGSELTPLAKKADLPRPAPPVARLSPSSARLGPGRGGAFSLSCTGTCRVTSATGTSGIVVDGTTFRVKAPRSRPGCPGRPFEQRGRITIRWAGTTDGDGVRTGGTTTGGGTLVLKVSWTVARDKGVLVLDHGVRWSNCG